MRRDSAAPQPAQPSLDDGWACAACDAANPTGTTYCGHCGTRADHSDVVDEHRLVTALFADISGFTTLADRLEAADLHRVISPVIGLLSGVAEKYEGTIAKYAGDAVMVFFGAPIAVEDHAERALGCALDMHAALQKALPTLPEEAQHLELHIGVNTGRVIGGFAGGDVRSDYSILGDSVNVAQRLESVAPPGQTYVGELTKRLTAAAFELEELGGLTLKGKPEPVLAWRLLGARRATEGPVTLQTSFVGRRSELAALRTLVDGLAEGRGGVATVLADPGVGKSRLLDELHAHADARGVQWLEARSISYGAAVPYWPFVDLLRRALAIGLEVDPADVGRAVSAVFSDLRPHAAALVGRLLGVPMPGDHAIERLSPEAFNRELSDTLAAWIAALAAEAPTMLVFEDVHWVDSASQDLLERIVRLLTPARLVLVLSGRPEAEDAVRRLTASTPSERLVNLGLRPLGQAATGEMVAEMLGGSASAAMLSAIADRTGGNPFFTQEFVRALQEQGALEWRAGQWELVGDAAASVPPTVDGVISARIDRLPKRAAAVLMAAAVVGRRVDLALLDLVTDLEGHLPGLVDVLVEAGLLDRVRVDGRPRLSFHHALVVDVAYARLMPRQRRELHRRVAEAAEVIYGSGDDVIDLLARHLFLARAGVKAVDHLERAAMRAKRLYANDQAIAHLHCAIELSRETERLTSRIPRLLLDAANVEQLVSAYDDAVRDYAEVRELTNDVRSWCGLSAVERRWGHYDEAIALVDDALRELHVGDDGRARLWLERTAALAVAGRLPEAIESAMAGLAEVSDTEGPVAAELMLRLARAEEAAGVNDAALTHALEAQRLLQLTGDERGLALAARIIGGLQWRLGDHESARATLEAGLALAERTGNAEEVAGCLINLGLALLALDRVEEAVACDERAVDLFRTAANLNGEALGRSNLAEKLLALGDLDGSLREGQAGAAIAVATGAVAIAADAQRILAQVLSRRGQVSQARVAAEEAARLFTLLGDDDAAGESRALVDEGSEAAPAS